jgi:hypothetical protein
MHLTPGLARQIATQMLVGTEYDLLVLRDLRKDFFRRRTGDNDVREPFHFRRTVDVRQRDVVGMRGTESSKGRRRAGIFQTTPGVHVGQDNDLVRRQDFGGLGHEADATERDDVGAGCLRLAAEVQTVSDEIGKILQFRTLIIMREDDGVLFLAKSIDLRTEVQASKGSGNCVH